MSTPADLLTAMLPEHLERASWSAERIETHRLEALRATRGLPALFSGGPMDTTCIPATLPLAEIMRRLEELRPTALQGYPSVIAMPADEKVAGRLTISPTAVTTSSEPLTPELRERIERGFGVGAVDQFGASEGIMGSSDPGSSAIAMPGDLAILEFVDEQGRPVPRVVDALPRDERSGKVRRIVPNGK